MRRQLFRCIQGRCAVRQLVEQIGHPHVLDGFPLTMQFLRAGGAEKMAACWATAANGLNPRACHGGRARCLRLSRLLRDPILVGTDEQLLAIGHAEFVEDIGEVMADRDARDAEAVGNVFV